IVRVATNDPGLIMSALDRGALGIVCPLVNTGEEARRFIHAMRYPPKGGRSWAPLKPTMYYGDDYTRLANDQILSIAQIETREAVENMEEILSTAELDAILVGPNDLGFTYGNQPKAMPDDPNAVQAIKDIALACKKHDVIAGIHCGDTKMAKEMISWGYQMVSIGADLVYLKTAAQQILSEMTNSSTDAKDEGPSY
ncbi:MAG: aldolase/citrate lyase family protein, partial [Alphaproteobacteria bacterium]|nr:aldolase/citrate lyase family protein [Alphaproteobacteria bacterium]